MLRKVPQAHEHPGCPPIAVVLLPPLQRSRATGSIRPVLSRRVALDPWRDAAVLFGLALSLRLVFGALLADTYDRDEFVYLALARDVAHGAMPYRDFPFFHPPGILVLLSFLNPLTTQWWPLVRLLGSSVDSITAVLVWVLGRHL